MFKCHLCKSKYNNKRSLDIHLNRKNKCNVTTSYQCCDCKRYFKQNKNLIEHTIKQTCKEGIECKDRSEVEIILNSKLSHEKKLDFLTVYSNFDENKIDEILKMSIPVGEQIKLLSNSNKITKSTTTNSNNITNSNNNNTNTTTNNIQINNFGKEDLSYMDNNYFTNLIMNQHIEKGYVQLIKDIYLNKSHPENSTIKVENINNKFAHVYNNGKWDAILKYELKEKLHKKNYTILKMHYDKLKNTMSYPKKEETRTFLSRDDTSDPHMMYVIDKIILLFYNEDDVVI